MKNRTVTWILGMVALGLLLTLRPEVRAEVRREAPPQAFSSGAMRSEAVLREIAATLKSIDRRLANVEKATETLKNRSREARHAP